MERLAGSGYQPAFFQLNHDKPMPPRRKNTTLNRDKSEIEKFVFERSEDSPVRHHVVLLDGTWNDEDNDEITSLVKLDRALVSSPSSQVIRYHRGIGNDEDNTKVQRIWTGVTGADEKVIRAGAYAQLVMDWQPNDIISIFGFSRGATTARMLARDLATFGVPDRLTVTRRDWNGKPRIVGCAAPKRVKKHRVNVAYLGLWDTVGSFGIPMDLGPIPFGRINLGKRFKLAPNVIKATHCLALDENRKAFKPILLKGDSDVVEEVWFSGVHSDVGGGYKQDALGKISMEFMLSRWAKELKRKGVPALKWKRGARTKLLPIEDDRIVRHWHRGFAKLKQPRIVKGGGRQLPKLHQSVLDFAVNGSMLRLPGRKKGQIETMKYRPPNLPTAGSYQVVVT
jgi:hypothetical protein